MSDAKYSPFLPLRFGPVDIRQTIRPDGTILLRSAVALDPHPLRMTERLLYWAELAPERLFMAQRDAGGGWQTLSYAQTRDAVLSVAQALLDRGLGADTPIVVLSENSIEHGVLTLAAQHIGVPLAPLSPAYALRSVDFAKLRACLDLLRPALILVSDGQKYEAALEAVAGSAEVVVSGVAPRRWPATPWAALCGPAPGAAVQAAFERVGEHTVAKILFTSGSTGQAKAVINTHGNICSNWQQIAQSFPFLRERMELVDWLPWSHTFGGNHNFGLAMYLGGSIYLDAGNPTPAGIETTVANLRDIAPSAYFNVPRGYEELIPRLRRDQELRERFFSRLQLLFYAGASLPQHLWDALEELSVETTGRRVVITTGLGCTESSPSALFCQQEGGFAGLVGVPVPGLDLKLVPWGDAYEARFRGPNISPGYWRQPELTAAGYDEEGYFCTGDALRFARPGSPDAGLLYEGRIAESFKLSSGTWVHAGALRAQLIAAAGGWVQDAVIAGPDRPFLSAIVFLAPAPCRALCGLDETASLGALAAHPALRAALQSLLDTLAAAETGGSTLIRRALLASFALAPEAGELTDKGSVNQRVVLRHRSTVVDRLYAREPDPSVLEANSGP